MQKSVCRHRILPSLSLPSLKSLGCSVPKSSWGRWRREAGTGVSREYVSAAHNRLPIVRHSDCLVPSNHPPSFAQMSHLIRKISSDPVLG